MKVSKTAAFCYGVLQNHLSSYSTYSKWDGTSAGRDENGQMDVWH